MFPRQKRLPRDTFSTSLAKGRRFSSEHFSVVVPSAGVGYAVVVSKKVARLSVTRHRIKRQVVVALKALSLPKSLIVFPKSSVNSVSYQDIKAELSTLIAKITNNL